MQYVFVEINLKLGFGETDVGNLVRDGVNLSADDGAWGYVNLTVVMRPPTAQTKRCAGSAVMTIAVVTVKVSGRKVVVVVVNRSSMLGPFLRNRKRQLIALQALSA